MNILRGKNSPLYVSSYPTAGSPATNYHIYNDNWMLTYLYYDTMFNHFHEPTHDYHDYRESTRALPITEENYGRVS